MWPPFKVSISETKVKFWPHIAAHFSISLCLNCWGGCVVAMQSVSICVKVKSKKWTTNDCEEEEEAQAGKDGKISMGSFPAKKMLWCFVSRIIHKNLDAMQAMMPSVYPLARKKKKNHLNLMCINLLRKSSSSYYNLDKHMCIYIFCPRQEECTDYYFLKSEDRRRMKSLCAVIDRPFFLFCFACIYLYSLKNMYWNFWSHWCKKERSIMSVCPLSSFKFLKFATFLCGFHWAKQVTVVPFFSLWLLA